MSDLVSVLIAVHNGESTIRRAVDSALSQTHRNLQIVIVDDGSTDGSWDIIERLAASDSRIITLRLARASGGPAVPRNSGLRLARGTYIALLDQDDAWLPEKITRQLEVFLDPDIGVVYSDATTDDGSSHRTAFLHRSSSPVGDVRQALSEQCFIPACTALWRREVTEAIGTFDTQLSSVDDYDYWFRAADAGFRFGHVDAPLAIYSTRGNRLSNDKLRHARLIANLLARQSRLHAGDSQLISTYNRRLRFASHQLALEARRRTFRGSSLLLEALAASPDARNSMKVVRLFLLGPHRGHHAVD